MDIQMQVLVSWNVLMASSTQVDERTQMALHQVWNYFEIFGQNSLGECVDSPCSVPMGIRSTS